MIHYIIQVLIFQTLFLAVYDLFLKKETFFQWNRAYLIATSVLAYIIPLIEWSSFSTYVQNDLSMDIPTITLGNDSAYLNEVIIGELSSNFHFTTLEIIYLIGIVLTSLLFVSKIIQIYSKIKKNTILKKKEYKLVLLSKQVTAFSFFKYLFLGKEIYKQEHQHIIDHELIHIKQKHSIDLLFFELQKILFWMNPFSYLYQNRISALHEFIADAKAIKINPKKQFFENLLNQTFQIEKFSFVNQFYKKSLIKKRIIMATKSKSKEILKLKYLLVIPLLISMFLYTSCEKNEDIKLEEKSKVYEFKELDKSPYLKGTEIKDDSKRKLEMATKISHEFFKRAKLIKSNKDNVLENHYISFVINEKGDVENVDYSTISNENLPIAKDFISSLPKFKPGIKDDEFVKTQMKVPFIGTYTSSEEQETIPFSVIEYVPTYPGCSGKNHELKKCMSEKISKHVAKKFNIDLAQNLDLSAGKKRISVQFEIDKYGNIADVRARAPHPKLQEEAIRIIRLLPKMKPGMHHNTAVNVRYYLPIIFNVEEDKKSKNKIISNENVGMINGLITNIVFDKKNLEDIVIESRSIEQLNNVISFRLKIPGKPTLSIKGNKFTKEAINNLKKSKAGDIIIVFDIKTKNSKRKTSSLQFSVKEKGFLEGTIDGKFGYLKSTKSNLISGVVGALNYESNSNYKVKKFKILIKNKSFSVNGNVMLDKVIKAMEKLQEDDVVKIYAINAIDENGKTILGVEPITIKIK